MTQPQEFYDRLIAGGFEAQLVIVRLAVTD